MTQLSLTGNVRSKKGETAHLPRWTRYAWRRVLILSMMGLLLGRASIEHVISPFGLAFFVILYEVAGKKRSWPAYFALIGAATVGGYLPVLQMLVSFVLYGFIRKFLWKNVTSELHFVPLTAGLTGVVAKLSVVGSVWTKYDLLMALAEGALVTLLCLIFLQCMAIFIGQDHTKSLRHEQIVSLVILAGSVITGFSGLTIHGVVMTQVAVDWMVLMFACGGMGVSAAGAIVVSLLALLNHNASLSDVAVMGFAGLLAGILKDAGRAWISLAFIVSTCVLTATGASSFPLVVHTAASAGIAILLYLCTPRGLHQEFAAYVPGTAEHKQTERQRVRRINALLTEKINEVGQVFEELSVTYADIGENQFTNAQQLVNHVVGTGAKQVCAGCALRDKCWDKEGLQTYQAMVQTVGNLESHPSGRGLPTQELRDRCVRLDGMMGVLRYNLDLTNRDAKWIEKIHEQKSLVAKQLSGVAGVVKAIANEIEEVDKSNLTGEDQVLAGLEQLGLYVDHVHIVSLDAGKVEIEITQPTQGAYEKSARVIAPLLSGIIGEHISVTHVAEQDSGPCVSTFSSARLFDVKTAVASVARDGRIVSGDTHTATDLGNGRFALAVSDGMGNGERARRESRAAIELLKKLLKAGFNEKLAIQTVNSTLLLRSKDEMFTTLDMALIDQFSAKTEFLKIGSAPSFIRRGNQVITLTGSNVPIGILKDIEVQSIEEQMRAGDILILLSDGLYDAPQQHYDKEDWLKQQIERLETTDPQAIADTLIETGVRLNHGKILDDMTVVVAVIQNHEPEWAAIKLPGVTGIRRRTERKQRGA